jgi:flagellar hook-basal body complex protein FliE
MSSVNKIGSEVLPLDVVRGPQGAPPTSSFADALGEALQAVDSAQVGADQEAAKLATGAGNLHETALALEKADLSMRVATKVRNRLVDAYQEIMRMGI